MAKRKQPEPLPAQELTPVSCARPQAVRLNAAGELLLSFSSPPSSYRLDLLNVQDQLLIDYANIREESHAVAFVEQWGLPIEGLSADRRLVDIDPDKFEVHSSVQQILESAAWIKWCSMLTQALRDDPALLASWVIVKPSKQSADQVDVYVQPTRDDIKALLPNLGVWYGSLGFVSASWVRHEDPIVLHYSKSAWKQWGNNAVVVAVQAFLKRAVDALLDGMTPELSFAPVAGDSRYALELRFRVVTPWQAIAYALARRITSGGSFGDCIRPNCGRMFAKKRQKKTCSEACEVYCRRNGITERQVR
jgi:hypothetical protein